MISVMAAIAECARQQLHESMEPSGIGLSETAQINLGNIHDAVTKQLESLVREPLLARVGVTWDDDGAETPEAFYICRPSAAGIKLSGIRVASYHSQFGRAAEFEPGDWVQIEAGPSERECRVDERTVLRATHTGEGWDGLDASFRFQGWEAHLASIARYLRECRHEQPNSESAGTDLLAQLYGDAERMLALGQSQRRAAIDKMTLRDQPVLDRYQGEVFRLPLDQRLVLLGPPGTGKTTTLIHRLAQKRSGEHLSREELDHLRQIGLDRQFLAPHAWVMYSPTELLKLYLRDAFNRESVPAGPRHLRTWREERETLGRNVLGVLRSVGSGQFIMPDSLEGLLRDESSLAVSALFDAFQIFVVDQVTLTASQALLELEQSPANLLDQRVSNSLRQLRLSVQTGRSDWWRPLLRESEALIANSKQLNERVRTTCYHTLNGILRSDPSLVDDVARDLPHILGGIDEAISVEEEDEAEDSLPTTGSRVMDPLLAKKRAADLLQSAIRALARRRTQGKVGRPGGNVGRLLERFGERLPNAANLAALGTESLTAEWLRLVGNVPERLVLSIPRLYAQFRRATVKQGGEWYNASVAELAIKSQHVSGTEVDVIILAMLRNARVVGNALGRSEAPSWLESIQGQYKMQVFVDEATDFSPVQLACMVELSHPLLRSWFACGDFQQRITTSGIRSQEDLDWVGKVTGVALDVRRIAVPYRQSPSLQALARLLSEPSQDDQSPAPVPVADDASPLLLEKTDLSGQAAWIAARILEVETSLGTLPSIAVFVHGEEAMDELVDALRPELAAANVRVVACQDGRVVGSAQEVRVFDIQHVKGLEFEAVFLVGVDILAQQLPALFDRFVFVGVTRAARFLAITAYDQLPSRLDPIRPALGSNDWSQV
jgi:hypothetical protein